MTFLFFFVFLPFFLDTLYDGTGKVSDIDYIFKIERFDNDWKTALEELEIPHKKRCRLTNINRVCTFFSLLLFVYCFQNIALLSFSLCPDVLLLFFFQYSMTTGITLVLLKKKLWL